MARKAIAKNIYGLVSRYGRTPGAKNPSRAAKQHVKDVAHIGLKCLDRAFKMAGRDVYSAELDDWKYVALWLACSVFAGREPGKPKKWNRKGMFRLIDDIEQIRTHRHNKGQPATDLDCCKELLKRPPYNKFKGNSHRPDYSASALRRRLGEARRVKRALDAMPKVGA